MALWLRGLKIMNYSGMIKQSECQGADENIQRRIRMVSSWQTSELDKIQNYWSKALTDLYFTSKHIYRNCCKRLEGWSTLMKKGKRKRGGIYLKTHNSSVIWKLFIGTISENQNILMTGGTWQMPEQNKTIQMCF